MVELNPKRHLSDEQCKTSAYHIAGEMKAHAEGRAELHHIWTPERCEVKAARLYHPAEAAAIRAVLVEMGALSAER